MSDFGNNDGSKKAGQVQAQTALNGFKLDSSQSSWLMDRLNALNEADKIEMSAQQAKLMRDHETEGGHSGSQNGQVEGGDPSLVMHPQVYDNNRQDHTANQLTSSGGELETGGGGDHDTYNQTRSGYQMSGEDDYHASSGANHNELDDAAILKSKIESLEQKLADMTTLTNPHAQQGQFVDENAVPPGQGGGHQPPQPYVQQQGVQDYSHQHEQQPQRHAPYNEGPVHDEAGYQQGYHENPGFQQQDANYVNHDPQGRGQYGGPPAGQQNYQQHLPAEDYQAQSHGVPQVGHYGQGVPQVQNELPQFLTPMKKQNGMRPGMVGALGLIVCICAGVGVAYSYYGAGVSDVVKNAGTLEQSRIIEKPVKQAAIVPVKPEVKQGPVSFGVENLIGEAGQKLPLGITIPNEAKLGSSLVILRGIPDWAKLNRGRKVNNMWIVAATDASNLNVSIPEDEPGTFEFEVDLVLAAGAEPVTKKVTAVIAAIKETKPVVVQPVAPKEEVVEDKNVVIGSTEELKADSKSMIKQKPVNSGAKQLIIDEALEEKWLERGTRLLRAGDVTAARLAFSHLAEQGSGRGALAMGMTFDPNQPSARIVAGIKPDVERALFWYRRALLLGNEGARDPIRLLEKK